MYMLFQCAAEAIAEHGMRGLADLVPGGGAVFDIVKGTWEKYRARCKDERQREEILQLAQASFEKVREEVLQSAQEAAPDQPELQAVIVGYLSQVPGTIRQSLKRGDDPAGRSLPAGFSLRGPDDLARILPMSLPRFKAGDPLPGRSGWTLDRFLGGGGFGEVWLAQGAFGMLGAVKFCKSLESRDRDLLHEGNVIARLIRDGEHPNIVPLRDAYLDGDSPSLRYDYIEGGDLGDMIHHHALRPPAERLNKIVTALHQLAGAVGRFHRLDVPIVHRDLKPANILYDRRSRLLRITDFGIGGIAARDMLDSEKHGSLTRAARLQSYLYGSYTPLYASPQQKAGAPPDPRDDVHALGVIAYQMLTGQLSQGVGSDYADDLRDLGVPDALIDLIRRCTAQRPDRRPKDAAEIAATFAGLRRSDPLARVPPAPPIEQPVANTPKPLPPAIIKAWTEAGAVAGWERIGHDGYFRFVTQTDGPPGAVPAFWFARWQEGVLARLPDPATAWALSLGDTQVTDAGLKELAGLKSLQSLHLYNTSVTDAGLTELAGLKGLQWLNLTGTNVTDAGLKVLARLKSLQTLRLGLTQVTGAGLKELAGLKSLQSLHLPFTQVTGAGLNELAGLKNLQLLDLFDTQMTDAGLKDLAALTNLQSLNLRRTKVTDAGLKELAGLKSLQSLDLMGTLVTDAGLKELAGLKSLQSLEIWDTKVTDSGRKELRKQLPGCTIDA